MNATFLANMRDKTEATLKARWRRYRALVEKHESLTGDETEELLSLVELLRITPSGMEQHSRTLAEHKRHLQVIAEREQRDADQQKAAAEFNAWQIERENLIKQINDKHTALFNASSDANQRSLAIGKAETWISMAKTQNPLLFNEVSGN